MRSDFRAWARDSNGHPSSLVKWLVGQGAEFEYQGRSNHFEPVCTTLSHSKSHLKPRLATLKRRPRQSKLSAKMAVSHHLRPCSITVHQFRPMFVPEQRALVICSGPLAVARSSVGRPLRRSMLSAQSNALLTLPPNACVKLPLQTRPRLRDRRFKRPSKRSIQTLGAPASTKRWLPLEAYTQKPVQSA